MTEFSPDQLKDLQIAHDLIDMGVPIFSAPPHSTQEFARPDAWQTFRPNHVQVERWRPGWALCMVTGVVFDVLDVDPRNGGLEGFQALLDANAVPVILGAAETPSDGLHYLTHRTHLAKTPKAAKGVDLQAGTDDGSGRGYIYIAPTVRLSRYGPNEGRQVAYTWITEPRVGCGPVGDLGLDNLVAVVNANRGPRRAVATKPATKQDDDSAAFYDDATDWTAESAQRAIDDQLAAVEAARAGEINSTLGGAARMLGRFMAGGYLSEEDAITLLMEALAAGGVHSDGWNLNNGKGWTAKTVIGAGLANGAQEPWTVEAPTSPENAGASVATPGAVPEGLADSANTSATGAEPTVVTRTIASQRLLVTSAADMTYWLQNALGSAGLSGYFLRGGQVTHTPRMDEAGYVEPAKGDENGPAQIQAVTAAQLTAKIQYAYACYKEVDEKDSDGKKTGQKREVPALFPLEAAKRATDAPEAMVMLRPLAGITHTPMVRADGSILGRPGYDVESRFLFLPGPGVRVPEVPEVPDDGEINHAVSLLGEMTAGFPWDSDDDRANYYGMLLTPLLRLITPPSYKMFGITAHQPGSGKTLLADVARIIHGGVLRSEMPDKEYEAKQMIVATLVGTSAPVVHVDNVSGVLRSAFLAGLLTADGELSERELGNNSGVLSYSNDRLWVVTGNNLSLGGDLVRRTVVINIDPNMADPEKREFAIADLKGWAADNRNRLLWALLVMVRAWVAAGRPLAARQQSDSFAVWEASVAGILDVCGVPGAFDAESGKKAAGGGDDDGLVTLLERVAGLYGQSAWTVADLLSGTVSVGPGDFVDESRDWLPSPVLDKLARSEAAGRKTLGYWLSNRMGRWVTSEDGVAYVLRKVGKTKQGASWRVERA